MTDFSHPATETDWETSGCESNNKQERIACDSVRSADGLLRDTVPNVGRVYMVRDGKFSPKQLAKAKAFWKRKTELRKTPGNCGRCGKPNPDTTHAHCQKCRDSVKRLKLLKRIEPVVVSSSELRRLESRVASLEHSIALMQVESRACYRRGYQTAQRHERKMSFVPDVTITKQELATMNHAYDKGDKR